MLQIPHNPYQCLQQLLYFSSKKGEFRLLFSSSYIFEALLSLNFEQLHKNIQNDITIFLEIHNFQKWFPWQLNRDLHNFYPPPIKMYEVCDNSEGL